MRIGVLTSLYPGPPRPFEGVFAELRWTGMARRGHDVHVVQPIPRTPGPLASGAWAELREMPRRETRAGLPVSRPRYLHLPGRARWNAGRFARVGTDALARVGALDVVVCDYAWPAAAAAPILRDRRLPCVVSGRGSDVLQVAGEAGLGDELAAGLRAAGHWCAVSLDLVRTMDRLGGVQGRGVLVPNGVRLDTFTPGDRSAARTALGLPATGALVLVVGHLIERKDPLLALDVFVRGAPADAQLVLIGRGPLRAAIVERIAELGLEERARVVAEVPPAVLATWYTASDLTLLTSRREGRPNVVLEALACGRPVLATEAGGTSELLAPFAAGSLAQTRAPDELGRMLAALLVAAPDPEALRASVLSLSWDASLAALERCLADAMEAGLR